MQFSMLCTPLRAQMELSSTVAGVVSVRSTQYPLAGLGDPANPSTDDTAAIRAAILAAPEGGTVLFPAGSYVVRDEIAITKRINLQGIGNASQVYQATDGKNLFAFRGGPPLASGIQGIYVRDLYLGSWSMTTGTSLLLFENVHRSQVSGLTMVGGYYGLHMRGCLINNINNVRSGTYIGGFFGTMRSDLVFKNQCWIFVEAFNSIASNANTFVAPCLEGGTNGIRVEEVAGSNQGNNTILGGSIEAVSGYAVSYKLTGQPNSIIGTHMEGNGLGDVYLDCASRVRIQSVVAGKLIKIDGGCYNTSISDSMVEHIVIGAEARRTILTNVALNMSGTAYGALDVEDHATDTQYSAVTDFNPYDWFGTTGIGMRNPNSSSTGVTPNVRLAVNGTVKAKAYLTGDIHFFKDGKHVQRMFEDEKGLYVENSETGAVSRIFLESDLAPVTEQLKAQQQVIETMRRELDTLRRDQHPLPRD
jgi:hypothetical protein